MDSTSSPEFLDKIVVGVDASEGSAAALRWALDDAALRGAQTEVDAVLAVAPGSVLGTAERDVPGRFTDEITREADGVLTAFVDDAVAERPARGAVPVARRVVRGEPVDVLVEQSAAATALVLGARGLGLVKRLFLGSVGSACAHHSMVPVVVVRTPPTDTTGLPVLVGVDGSDASVGALRWAADEARRRRVPLHVVFVWKIATVYASVYTAPVDVDALRKSARKVLDTTLAGAAEVLAGTKVDSEAVEGVIAPTLLARAERSQLLVVGARGHGGFSDLRLGSVSHQCVVHADRPVAIVHS